MAVHTKLLIASKQLESAIGLFVSNTDKVSAITLAGAADVIFNQLLISRGIENFTQMSLRREVEKTGLPLTLNEHGKDINNVLRINALKHLDKGEDPVIEIDIDTCALAAISKAVVNYILLNGRSADFIQAFIAWVRLNYDPDKLKEWGWEV